MIDTRVQHQIFMKIWHIYRVYADATEDGQFAACLDELEKLCIAFPDKFTKELVYAVIDEIDRRVRGRRKEI